MFIRGLASPIRPITKELGRKIFVWELLGPHARTRGSLGLRPPVHPVLPTGDVTKPQKLLSFVKATRESYQMGKFDWGVRSVIIFQHVQFWIRLPAVSYRGKKIRTVVSPAVRSVNKSLYTRNCVQNEPDYAICVIFVTRVYYKAPGTILCALIWQIRHNVLTITTLTLQVTARCQHWARPVPWWQPMKFP